MSTLAGRVNKQSTFLDVYVEDAPCVRKVKNKMRIPP